MATAWLAFPFPMERFDRAPSSPLVTDRIGRPMLELVSSDDQWRQPVPLDQMSQWLTQATIAAEDKRFYSHVGVDPIAIARAVWQDARAARIVSGASTITMQVCRMIDKRPRTWYAKTIQAFRALQLERLRTKDQILESYLNRAPYGGNLCGVEAASQAYFGKRAVDLSLAEAALLAGLPQSPRRHRPDRYPNAARSRRDTVLRRMLESGLITAKQKLLASSEPVPSVRERRSPVAPHAAWLAMRRRPNGGQTTIDSEIQFEVEHAVAERAKMLPDGVDVAAVVLEISSGDIVAMVGSSGADNPISGQVNGVLARRAPGSTLKPFIYATAFAAGRLGPDSTVYDIPIERAGWTPANFDQTFAGPVPAAEALRRSLNVPAILIAEQIGLARSIGLIESAGIHLPDDAQSRGGLAVVVGATEVTLLDLTNGYATLGRGGVLRTARLFLDEPSTPVPALDANVCSAIDDILSSRRRRPHGLEQLDPQDVPWFMWKTGTSSGRRDAWAIGHNGRYAIGVWVGRFCGRGRAELVGAEAAEPLLAALFIARKLRQAQDPDPPKPWAVVRPLRPPAELTRALRITSPNDGAIYLAVSGRATVHPRSSCLSDLTWFLNGRVVERGHVERLSIEPGSYELRCVNREGNSSSVRFLVR